MASIISNQSGNWGATTTWVGGVVPGNGDDVTIANGHTVTFQNSGGTAGVDQSGFAAGLNSLVITGTLRFPTNASYTCYLKMGNNANITGAGSLYVGNSAADPIPRTSSATIYMQGTGTITTTTVRMYGAYNALNHTILAQAALVNATTLVLTDDLGFTPAGGEQFVVGCGGVSGVMGEASKGVYTITAYDPGTKTITIAAPGISVARSQGDYLAYITRPIIVQRASAGTTALIGGSGTAILQGVQFINSYACTTQAATIDHCTVKDATTGGYILTGPGMSISYTTIQNCTSAHITAANALVYNVAVFNGGGLTSGVNQQVINSYAQNNANGLANSSYNCTYSGCSSKNNSTSDITSSFGLTLFGCTLGSTTMATSYRTTFRKNLYMESFDHAGIAGAYRMWCKGGYGLTTALCKYGPNNVLKIVHEEDNPVFRDFWIIAPANRPITYRIAARKDYPGADKITLQVIDPGSDPLWDLSHAALATVSCPDVTDQVFTVVAATDVFTSAGHGYSTGDAKIVYTTNTLPTGLVSGTVYYVNRIDANTFYLYDTKAHAEAGGTAGRVDVSDTGTGTHYIGAWQDIGVTYKASYARPLIVRVLAQNASGNSYIYTGQLEQFAAPRRRIFAE